MVKVTPPSVALFASILLFLLFSFLNTRFSLLQSYSAPGAAHKHQQSNVTSVDRLEEGLARARAAIREATRTKSYNSYKKNQTFIPRGSIYRNPYAFHQSYIEMEKSFKIWVYKDGEPPLFHRGPMKEIYSIEGHLIDQLERPANTLAAAHPDDAHAFFLPFSIANVVHYLYRPVRDYDRHRLRHVVADYVLITSRKYPYWNRSDGADHFFASCHDWGPDASNANPVLLKNLIRVLCNANVSEGFDPRRDASLPEIKLRYDLNITAWSDLNHPIGGGGDRPILAFFAGGAHGHVRTRLFEYWKGRDSEVQVYEYLPKNMSYSRMLSLARFCLCPSGYEVASPRLVEAIQSGCVPVIVSDGYYLPFSDVLDWSSFSIHVPVAMIPDIKTILQGIGEDEYLEKQKQVQNVRRHFVIHRPPQPYDLLHMVIHSVWLRRLNVRLQMQ